MSPLFNNFNISLIDSPTAVALLILMGGGGSTFALIRCNRLRARQADPEAIALDMAHAVEDRVAPGSAHDSGVPENTVTVEGASTTGQAGAVEGGAALSVGDDEGRLEESQEIRGSGEAGTLEVCDMVEDGVALGMEVCGAIKDGVEVCSAVEDDVALSVDAST
ncbi:hypothetical protein V8D89_013843 [Ganoderma adspersum]